MSLEAPRNPPPQHIKPQKHRISGGAVPAITQPSSSSSSSSPQLRWPQAR